MRNLIIFVFIIITFSACSFTSHHKINSNLEFELVPENERKTYIIFGKEQFLQEKESDENYFLANENFADEFADQAEDFDPLEPYNRVMTSINDFLYINVLSPTAKAYSDVVNEDLRIGVSNFFHNITFPIRFANNILQFKFSYAK